MPALLKTSRHPVDQRDVIRTWDRLWARPPSDKKDDHLLARERRSPRFQQVRTYLESAFGDLRGLRVAELGCGRGDLSALLAEQGAQVTLLDASDLALAQARRRFARLRLDADFVCADLLEPPPRLFSAFDVAVSTGVIEHFRGRQRTQAIAAHAAAVREGGAVIISVPNAACIPYRLWKLYLELRGCWPYGMEIPYDRQELVHRAKDAGLSDCNAVGVGFWQSVGDHWLRNVCGRRVDWVERRSAWDQSAGMSLVLCAYKPEAHRPSLPARRGRKTIERHFANRGHGCEFEMEIAWIRAHLPATATRVVDVGCGGGGSFPAIGPGRVIGVDYQSKGLALTRQQHGDVPLVCGSAERLPFQNGSVEAITAQHVIEHLVDPVAAAHQWFQALKPGGAALILTPNAVFTDLTIFDDPTHIRLYTPTQLCLLLRQVGFEIVESRSLGLPWFREYNSLPSGWRLRRWVTRHARGLARWPGLRWKGQTLCVAARRPMA